MASVPLFRRGIEVGAVAIVNRAVGGLEGAGIRPHIDARAGVQRVPVGEAGDAVLRKQPAGDPVRHRRKVQRPHRREALLELLRPTVLLLPFVRHLHERRVGPDFITCAATRGDVVPSARPFHVFPDGAEMRHPDVHRVIQAAPGGFFRRGLLGYEQRNTHAVLLFDFVEELAPAAHGLISLDIVGFVEIAHDHVAA